jgi:iron-sulfur cluster repair protein YtfE (RIC family)
VGLHQLEHDHTTLSQAVAELRATVTREPLHDRRDVFVSKLDAVMDDLFEHFAREEEGLFPYILEQFPDQSDAIAQLQAAHDRICGAASRISALSPEQVDLAVALFQRFDAEYTGHAQREADFLRGLGARLSGAQQEALASILRDL